MQDGDAADGEADHGSQRGDLHYGRAEVEDVGGDGGDREDESQHIEPERGADWSAQVFAKTQLQQQSGESDGRHDHQGDRAGESGTAGIDHHQSEREQEKSGGNNAPAAGLRLGLERGGRVGSDVGQGVPSQVIQGGERSFQIGR